MSIDSIWDGITQLAPRSLRSALGTHMLFNYFHLDSVPFLCFFPFITAHTYAIRAHEH